VRTDLLSRVAAYYEAKLDSHGPTPAGVDWSSAESQALRFAQFFPLLDGDRHGSVIDYGCGYGALRGYLRDATIDGPYTGHDVSPAMIESARRLNATDSLARFTSDRAALTTADYAVASGIFNVKQSTPEDEWRAYVDETLADIASLSRKGFAFNVLSRYSDVERRRGDLYYADPLALFDYCKRTFSPRVSLLHDYPLYEFTILVRL
jgi:SAM-dependent methyltransferase